MKVRLLLLLISLLSWCALSSANGLPFECSPSRNSTQGVYTVYDTRNGVLHVASFIGEPTFMIYRTPNGSKSLDISWTKNNTLDKVTLSGYDLLYGFVVRNLIEFKVAGASVNFDLKQFEKNTTNSFHKTPFSKLKFNITSLAPNCDETGRINISLQQGNISSNLTQLDILFTLQAFAAEGRLPDQPRYAYNGENSVIDVLIQDYQYTLTTEAHAASRLALELDFIRSNQSKLSFSSEKNIDDEYTPAVFTQNSLRSGQDRFLYWKPIAYVDGSRVVETSVMASYLNGTYNNTREPFNTTGFYHSLQKSVNVSLERAFILFGTDGDSTLNTEYLFFRMELGLGVPPTDSISLPLLIAIGVGFGLPVFGLLLGIIGMCFFLAYKCCCRKSTRNKRYVMIN